MKNTLLFLIIALIFNACTSTSKFYSYEETQSLIDEKFQDSLFAHAHWGVLIQSLDDDQIWYQQNADKMFMPASNEKIPTSAAALITLGPDFMFESGLYYKGEIEDSVLKGDLIVKGNGDPTFYTRFFDDSRTPFFNWADTLLQIGITKIEGNIIGDDNAFDDYGYGMGWTHSGLDSWYSAESGALQFNENYVDLYIVQPATVQDSVEIIPNVPSSYFSIINKTTATDSGRTRISVNRPFGTNDLIISGLVHIGNDTLERSPSIFNPTLFYTTVLKETLQDKGILVSGKALDCDDIEGFEADSTQLQLLAIHKSPPLKEILKGLMKRSQNMYAETMVKTMGWQQSGLGSFGNGKEVVEKVLEDFGIEPKTYAYRDGSGLSRYNFISPRQIVKILKGMRNSQHWETWKEIQPIAGVDGTLKRRMRGTKAEGNVRAKTGTISNVRGLSGYVTTDAGEEIVFSFLINGHLRSSRETELITDKVLDLIAEYPKKAILENK
ncbi:MAG: D-alanyl-D-alanine carboxypeptidase/D-alanyl-D-alanine-endopeptidase [Calditrichaeota bacterium]|nr:MAG: D-alanyl-D-alanine carboxypeptidase/D-alanyl-D-alanine-endopeptidase [Calditrichota bacterium]MBL1206999.1 D-alanyl-D-alanine carboxypeptidase/D-alanyl-D-alanine-endopeptidase [Calditrichota bacterium]NOG46826.1 D-alanyl-D-alanine carboxypeptidase/D-alanyl-D-alanine-endopeptidase [Calditrichota bacterium]